MVITRTDPEFAKQFENFAGSEVVGEVSRHCPRRRGTLQFLQYLSAAGHGRLPRNAACGN